MAKKTSDQQLRRISSLMREVQILCFPSAVGTLFDADTNASNSIEADLGLAKASASAARQGAHSALAAGDSTAERGSGSSSVYLTVAPPDAGHRWIDKKDPVEAWRSLNAGVQLVTGVDGMLASVIVLGESPQLRNWEFEAVALGANEIPDFHRELTETYPSGSVIPLNTSPHFCLNQPLRIALYVSDGLSVLGCLVFAMDGR